MARGKYLSDVKPRFSEIEKWCELGATDKEIAENLGISQSANCDYKNKHKEYSELIKKSRRRPLAKIKAALYKRAVGFSYKEIKETESDKNGRTIETYTKTALPDPACAMILLKHWDKEGSWTNDPATLDLKRQELELKKKESEKNNW